MNQGQGGSGGLRVWLPGRWEGRRMATKDRLRVGCIGAGQIVREQHFPVLAALPCIELTWVADIDAKAASRMGREFQCASPAVADLGGWINQVDVVVLAAPYGVRQPYFDLLAAATSRPAILVEKPFAKTLAEHRSIVALRSAERVACNYCRRQSSSVQTVRRMVRDETFGPLQECRFGLGSIGGYSVGEKYYSDPKLAGGGLLLEIGVHAIDVMLYCTGAQPSGSLCGRMEVDHGFDIHTEGRLNLRLQSGAEIPLQFEVSLMKETSGVLEFVFPNHTVDLALFADAGLRLRSRRGEAFEIKPTGGAPIGYPLLAAYWLEFLGGVATGIANETSARCSEGVTAIIEAAYQLEQGTCVEIAPIEEFGGRA